MLARADTIMRCLRAHTVKQVLIAVALGFSTLVTDAMALTLTLCRCEFTGLQDLTAIGWFRDLRSAFRGLVQVDETLVDSLGIFVALGLEHLITALHDAA